MKRNMKSYKKLFFQYSSPRLEEFVSEWTKHRAQHAISNQRDFDELKLELPFEGIASQPKDMGEIVEELKSVLLPGSVNMSSPYFIGHMTTHLPNFVFPIAQLLVALNQNVVKEETSKVLTLYERKLIAEMHQLIYGGPRGFYQQRVFDKNETLGIVCSGGTLANISALLCARNKAFPQWKEIGMNTFNSTIPVIICSERAHYSMEKAARMLGLGSKCLQKIPVDRNQKMRIDLLEMKLKECYRNKRSIIALVGVAGTTECGSIDPLFEMAQLAQQYKTHFHVDAAWGGAFLFSKRRAVLFKGIEMADTVTLDPHKQLYVPMGMGMLFFKDPHLADEMELTAEYTIRKNSFDLGQRSFEGSRPAHALYLKMNLDMLGKSGYAQLVDDSADLARKFAEMIYLSEDFQLLIRPELNIILYRYLPKEYRDLQPKDFTAEINEQIDQMNLDLQKRQFLSGRTFVSRTHLCIKRFGENPITCLRVVLANPMTEVLHLEEVLNHQREIVKAIVNSG